MTHIFLLALLLLAPLPAPVVACRVVAHSRNLIPSIPLREITVALRPGCPPNGKAHIRLHSTSGATDPAHGFATLTPAHPLKMFSGVLTHWTLEWESVSHLTYPIPERRE